VCVCVSGPVFFWSAKVKNYLTTGEWKGEVDLGKLSHFIFGLLCGRICVLGKDYALIMGPQVFGPGQISTKLAFERT